MQTLSLPYNWGELYRNSWQLVTTMNTFVSFLRGTDSNNSAPLSEPPNVFFLD